MSGVTALQLAPLEIEDLDSISVIQSEITRSLALVDQEDAITWHRHQDLSIGTEPSMSVTPDVIRLPQFRAAEWKPTEFFAAMQEWDGWVTDINDETFFADLRDVTACDDDVTEVAEIPLDELSPSQRDQLKEGLKFRWLVGYSKSRGGQFGKKQVIYFRPATFQEVDDSEPAVDFGSLRSRIGEMPHFEL